MADNKTPRELANRRVGTAPAQMGSVNTQLM